MDLSVFRVFRVGFLGCFWLCRSVQGFSVEVSRF